MDAQAAKALRAPFRPEQIGKLPKPTKRENPKGKCQECGGYHGLPAVHLDYVGHAACTDRLLEVDPEWTWKPMARGTNGEPLLVNGGLWIELTVCGVTRPGFGDESNGKGMKEVIGDAIRNAAMRFGVALDLWSKEDLHPDESGAAATVGDRQQAPEPEAPSGGSGADTNGYISKPQRDRLWAIVGEHKVETDAVRKIVIELTGQESTAQIPKEKYDAIVSAVQLEGVPFS